MSEPVPADQIRELLRGYAGALDAAESLPKLVRVPSRTVRPGRLRPLSRRPRHTLGTATMVTRHVQRSTAALTRRFARLAATRGLSDDEQRAQELVKTFRESLGEVHGKLIAAAFVVAAVVLTPAALEFLAGYFEGSWGRSMLTGAEQDRLVTALTRIISTVPKPDAVGQFLAEVGKTGPAGLSILLGTVAAVAYLIFRPLFSPFRVKRVLFNLAGAGPVDLTRTTMAANVARSTGLYELERAVFARLGGRPPREAAVDLWISAAGLAAVVILFLASADGGLAGGDVSFALWWGGVTAGLAAARVTWLVRTVAARHDSSGCPQPPAVYLAPGADRPVETRSVVETATFGGLLAILPSPFSVPSPVWVRLVRERRALESARLLAAGAPRRRPNASAWPALGSAVLLSLFPPLPVAVHLTRLARLQPPGVGAARRVRARIVPLLAATTMSHWVGGIYLIAADSPWAALPVLAQAAAIAAAYGSLQREHNGLVEHAAAEVHGKLIPAAGHREPEPPRPVDPPEPSMAARTSLG